MAITRNDVARRAGVSPAVVSYVLNDGPRPVSVAARARVMDAVQALGYRPDGLARSLRAGRTKTLGLVVPDASNPFFAELALAVEDAAFARGYAVMVCNSADDLERERTYLASLAERRIDGLVLVSTTSDQDLSAATSLSIPVVALDRAPDDVPVSTIRSDNRGGARLGAEHLLGHGHASVAFVGGPDAGISDERRLGWADTVGTGGIEVSTPFTYEGGRDALALLYAAGSPTAVLVSSDIQAIGLMSGLADAGLRAPEDLAIVSVDGTIAGAHAVPALTTIAQPITGMGSRAVLHLIDHPRDVIHLALPNALVVRRSCGCVRPTRTLEIRNADAELLTVSTRVDTLQGRSFRSQSRDARRYSKERND